MSERLPATQNLYRLPVPQAAVEHIVTDNVSHTGSYAGSIDYAVALGTPVYAAADGVVTRVRDNLDRYGNDPSFGQQVNYVTVRHQNDELSEYLHLAKGSAQVMVGESVRAGQVLARTGLSGWLTAPHLHFMVYVLDSSPQQFHCLRVRF